MSVPLLDLLPQHATIREVRAAKAVLSLPIYPELMRAQLDAVVDAL